MSKPSRITKGLDRVRVNDHLTAALAALGWEARTDEDDEWLNDLVHRVSDELEHVGRQDDEELLARVVLSVDVVKGRDPGSDTPNGYEPPHEYVCVREATVLGAQAFGPTGILSVLGEGYFEDPDPDGSLIEAVQDGLSELAPRPAHWPSEEEEARG